MFTKIVAFGVFLAVASGSPYGPPVSSQTIIRHDTPVHHDSHHGPYLSHYSSAVVHPIPHETDYAADLGHSAISIGHYTGHEDHHTGHEDHHTGYEDHYAGHEHHYASNEDHYGSSVDDFAAPVEHYAASVEHYDTPVDHYSASIEDYATPIDHYAAPVAHYEGHDTYAHPKYEYTYTVADPHTGDHKTQHETRDGDAVHGYYNLVQPDGTVREVKYTADHDGFKADVQYSGHSTHPESDEHGHSQWN